MKILVTGAAGQLGRAVAKYLLECGYEVTATDIQDPLRPVDFPLVFGDLCDYAICEKLVEGMDAVVHVGNIPNPHRDLPHVVYQANTSMNYNIFHACSLAGVRKVLFASTVQVYGTEALSPNPAERDYLRQLAPITFPMDRHTPVCPLNWYALSKVAGEEALVYFSRLSLFDSVAIRFPMLVPWVRPVERPLEKREFFHIWRFLTTLEAARLVECCLRASLPGYRAYFPVFPGTVLDWSPQKVLEEFYPNAPLSKPVEEIESLVDISHITEETGWVPGIPTLETSPLAYDRKKPRPDPVPATPAA